jgi:hypothetical protein
LFADHRAARAAVFALPAHRVARGAALAAGCVVDLEAVLGEGQAVQRCVVQRALGLVEHMAVEGHALRQLEAAIERGQSPDRHQHQQRQQREVEHQQRQLPPQQRVYDERGDQVERQQAEGHGQWRERRRCHHHHGQQRQQRQCRAQ